jgi:hypothetical protein
LFCSKCVQRHPASFLGNTLPSQVRETLLFGRRHPASMRMGLPAFAHTRLPAPAVSPSGSLQVDWKRSLRRYQPMATQEGPQRSASVGQSKATGGTKGTTGSIRRVPLGSKVTEARATAQRAKLDAQAEARNDQVVETARNTKRKPLGGKKEQQRLLTTGEPIRRLDERSTTTCSITWVAIRATKRWNGTARHSG